MKGYIIAFVVALVAAFVLTPATIRVVQKLHYGQYIRQDGPKSHLVKRGTPTLGGAAIILSVLLGWGAAALYRYCSRGTVPSCASLLTLFCMAGFGLIGFIDDFLKVRKKRNLGLTIHAKLVGQFIISTAYAVLSLILPTHSRFHVARLAISWVETPVINLDFVGKAAGIVLFVIWVNSLMTAWTNAINLTDGLDGLAAGSSTFAFAGFAVIAFWESYHLAASHAEGFQYTSSDPQDMALIALATVAACLGFLWYNANPAEIFMGDTGSLALGGLFAALSVNLHVELLAIVLGGLFVMETMSDVIQISAFRLFHKRVFRMAPLHHHFELLGWKETRVVVRFWMMELGFTVVAVILFYMDWLVKSGQLR
ncbi:MAG: phospho-N-acetylmuramoyl-pentapeptide-transferase [Aeriscardovia sp.]|nr:phospho-N-acetylmuramoyl-pentapeptide-transferase [Aeriscardovia sp.]